MEVGDGGIFTRRKGNELVTCAFDDGEGNEGVRHYLQLLGRCDGYWEAGRWADSLFAIFVSN